MSFLKDINNPLTEVIKQVTLVRRVEKRAYRNKMSASLEREFSLEFRIR